MKNIEHKYFLPLLLLVLFIATVTILWIKLHILPTFDDWVTLSSPNFDHRWYQYILPYGSFWRPFDAMVGYIVATDYHLFPVLNHLLIFFGHGCNAIFVFAIARQLQLNTTASSIGASIFLLSPCVLATVYACDSLNQTYSQFWGLLIILIYLKLKGRKKYLLWGIFIWFATWSKENGLAWAVVPPILAYGFRLVNKKTLYHDIVFGLCIACIYGAIRLSLPNYGDYNPDYQQFDAMRRFQEIAMLLANSFMAIDIMSIVHTPSRNMLLAISTIILSIPLSWMLFIRQGSKWKHRECQTIALCALITVLPNLLLSLSMMNAYASMGMIALLIAYLLEQEKDKWWLYVSCTTYMLSALIVSLHYGYSSWQTSLAGKQIAQEIIKQSKHPAKRVYCILKENQERKFSSFYVLPKDAFGWGMAVKYETGYQWPEVIKDTTLSNKLNEYQLQQAALQALKQDFDCAWIIDHKRVTVIENKTHH